MNDDHWSEQRDDDSAYQAACADAELREWETDLYDPPRTTPRSEPPTGALK